MKNLFWLIVISLVIILNKPNLAQESEKIDLSNKFALQFQILRNFEFSGFNGSAFSGKYCFDNTSSIRLSFTINQSTNKKNDQILPKDTSLNGTGSISIDDLDFLLLGVGIQYLHNIRLLNSVHFYLGGGPYLSSNSANGDSKDKYSFDPKFYSSSQENNYFEYGVNIVTGVEWFVADNISLSGEYEIYYFNRDYDFSYNDEYGKRTITQTTTGFDYSSAKFGVAVYF